MDVGFRSAQPNPTYSLWGKLDCAADGLPLADWQRAELDRRLDALADGTSVGAPWETVRRRITGAS